MAVSGLLLPSANGLSVPARVFRQSLGALFRASAATGSLGAISGCLAGPDNTMGELTLLSDALVRVQPFVAVIQGTHNVKQGQYTVPNDELVDLGIPAKDASQTRRAYIAVRVADSVEAGVASSAATDGAWLEIQQGALAASNPALPAATPNTLYLGELLIPSTASGSPVTITKYNPRTMLRGGIIPIVADGGVTAGHDGAPGIYTGQYRDHPVYGLQRWRASDNSWQPVTGLGMARGQARQTVAQPTLAAGWQTITFGATDSDTHGGFAVGGSRYTVQPGQAGSYLVEGKVQTNGDYSLNARILKNGNPLPTATGTSAQTNAAILSSTSSGTKLVDLAVGDYIELQGWRNTAWATTVYADGTSYMIVVRIA